MATENVAALEPQDYTLIADAVDEYLGFDITTREQQDRITRWARAVQAPLAGPVDASGEPESQDEPNEDAITDRAIKLRKSPISRSTLCLMVAELEQLVDAAASLPSPCPHCGSRGDCLVGCEYKKFAAAVPSSPAQARVIREIPPPRFTADLEDEEPAVPPSSPVADSPTLDDVRIVLRQFEMRAYRADALPPGNHSPKPTLTEWREMAQWLYDTLRRAVPTLAESGEVNAGHR